MHGRPVHPGVHYAAAAITTVATRVTSATDTTAAAIAAAFAAAIAVGPAWLLMHQHVQCRHDLANEWQHRCQRPVQ